MPAARNNAFEQTTDRAGRHREYGRTGPWRRGRSERATQQKPTTVRLDANGPWAEPFRQPLRRASAQPHRSARRGQSDSCGSQYDFQVNTQMEPENSAFALGVKGAACQKQADEAF